MTDRAAEIAGMRASLAAEHIAKSDRGETIHTPAEARAWVAAGMPVSDTARAPIEEGTWRLFKNRTSIFDGLTCWVRSLTPEGTGALVEFSDDGPARMVSTDFLHPVPSKRGIACAGGCGLTIPRDWATTHRNRCAECLRLFLVNAHTLPQRQHDIAMACANSD